MGCVGTVCGWCLKLTLFFFCAVGTFVAIKVFTYQPEGVDLTLFDPKEIVDPGPHEFVKIATNGITLNVLLAGPADGKPVMLLHGFPQTALLCWYKLIPTLAAAGYRVIAPDQRGYNTSAKPEGISAYHAGHLAEDVVGLMDHFNIKRMPVIGHDWGAAVAWVLACEFPDRVTQLQVLNTPHPLALKAFFFKSLTQLMRSWYIFFFQLPVLPEMYLAHDDYTTAVRIMAKTPSAFPLDAVPRAKQGWSEPEALHSMINWYRAALQRPSDRINGKKVKAPTQIIWGEQDVALGPELPDLCIPYCEKPPKITRLPQASHWVHLEYPKEANAAVMDFLRKA